MQTSCDKVTVEVWKVSHAKWSSVGRNSLASTLAQHLPAVRVLQSHHVFEAMRGETGGMCSVHPTWSRQHGEAEAPS